MRYSDDMRKIFTNAVANHMNDIDAAVDEAEPLIRALPEYPSYERELVRQAIRVEIGSIRHVNNTEILNNAGKYGGPAKVKMGASMIVNQIAMSAFNYAIGGTTLGKLRGSQLAGLASIERKRGDGHYRNAVLLDMLIPIVPPMASVEEAIKESKLRELMNEASRLHGGTNFGLTA